MHVYMIIYQIKSACAYTRTPPLLIRDDQVIPNDRAQHSPRFASAICCIKMLPWHRHIDPFEVVTHQEVSPWLQGEWDVATKKTCPEAHHFFINTVNFTIRWRSLKIEIHLKECLTKTTKGTSGVPNASKCNTRRIANVWYVFLLWMLTLPSWGWNLCTKMLKVCFVAKQIAFVYRFFSESWHKWRPDLPTKLESSPSIQVLYLLVPTVPILKKPEELGFASLVTSKVHFVLHVKTRKNV